MFDSEKRNRHILSAQWSLERVARVSRPSILKGFPTTERFLFKPAINFRLFGNVSRAVLAFPQHG